MKWALPVILVLSACVTAPRPTPAPVGSVTGSTNVTGEGLASWYGKQFAGKQTASGELFDPNALTAAHRTLKFGTCVRVESLTSGKSVDVRVNDRGPFVKERLIDLSEEAARQRGIVDEGVGKVRLDSCG